MKRLFSLIISVLFVFVLGVQADWYWNAQAGHVDYYVTGPTGGVAGDIVYHDGTSWVALNKGTNGQVLTLAAGIPSWAATGGTDVKVGVDAAATAGYFGVAYNDGIFRFTQNHFTMADGGSFVTLSLADHATARTALGLAIGSDTQAWDGDLDTYAGITPSANVQTLLSAANYAAFITSLSLTVGTDTEAWDADLDTYAGITPSANVQTLLGAADFATFITSLSLTIGTNTQAWDGDLDTYAGITPSANIQTYLASASFAAMVGNLSGTATAAFSFNAQNITAAGFISTAQTAATPSAAFTINWTTNLVHQVTITGATLDITFTNPSGPCFCTLVVIQGDGDDTIDWANEADILWPGGVAPTLSTGAADVDVVRFYFNGTSYYGLANLDFQ